VAAAPHCVVRSYVVVIDRASAARCDFAALSLGFAPVMVAAYAL